MKIKESKKREKKLGPCQCTKIAVVHELIPIVTGALGKTWKGAGRAGKRRTNQDSITKIGQNPEMSPVDL